MYQFERKVNFKYRLKILLILYQCFGISNVAYNRRTRRFEASPLRQSVSGVVLKVLKFASLLATLVLTVDEIVTLKSSITIHDLLTFCRMLYTLFNTYVFSLSYLRHRGTFVDTLNQIVVLFERIEGLTDGRFYFPSSFRKLLNIKLLLFAFTILNHQWHESGIVSLGLLACQFFSVLLMELTYWAHLYGNLVLACLYLKMIDLLCGLGAEMEVQALKSLTKEVISISYEIHHIKEKFNDFFKFLHIFCYFGLFNDIFFMYRVFQFLLVFRLYGQQVSTLKVSIYVTRTILSGVWASYNLFLNGHVGEAVLQAEKIFRRTLLSMYYGNHLMRNVEHQREMDLFLIHHHILDISTKVLNLFAIDHQFSFDFIKNVTFAYAIVCFQNFMGDCFQATEEQREILKTTGFGTLMTQD